MEKNDEIKFGKHKGKTWGQILEVEADALWGDWWASTPSTGKWMNKDNKDKRTWKEWRGSETTDTRVNSSRMLETTQQLAKLENIENLCKTILACVGGEDVVNASTGVDKWEEEA